MTSQGALVIEDELTWQAVWCQTFAPEPIPDRPVVDFSESTVLAAFLGERPSCGFSVSIHRVFAVDGGLLVQVYTHAEEPGLGYCLEITHPFTFAQVPGRWHAVRFEWTQALNHVNLDVQPEAAPLGSDIAFRLGNTRAFPPPPDLSNLTLRTTAPWVVERDSGGGWVRVDQHWEDNISTIVRSGENVSWTWRAASSAGLPPVVAGFYRFRLSLELTGTPFELVELFRLA